jgi:hypothetical protein
VAVRKMALLILPLGLILVGLLELPEIPEASPTMMGSQKIQAVTTTQASPSSQEQSGSGRDASSDGVEILTVVSGIISIVAFLFAVWIWMRSDMKIKELAGALHTVYDVAGSILWEMNTSRAEDIHARLRQAERALGMVSSMRTLASKYVESQPGFPQTELGALIERGVVWTESMMWNLETSDEVKSIWVVTPDLKPEISDSTAGILINNNLRAGKNYIYFCPDDLPNLLDCVNQLYSNIGVASASKKLASRVQVVPFPAAARPELFRHGNIVVYFHGDPQLTRGHVFEEVLFTRVPQRGLFWQEYDDTKGENICHLLRERLREWKDDTLRNTP